MTRQMPAGQDLQALAAQRPPPLLASGTDVGTSKHGAVGLEACWIQGDGQDREAGWLLEADDPNRWQLIKVDDPTLCRRPVMVQSRSLRLANQTLLSAGSMVQVPVGGG